MRSVRTTVRNILLFYLCFTLQVQRKKKSPNTDPSKRTEIWTPCCQCVKDAIADLSNGSLLL